MDNQLMQYIENGIKGIMRDIVKATFKDPAESLFMAKFGMAVTKGSKIRAEYEEMGEHIPPFLIASITSTCNLHCKGCYARENKICSDEKQNEMTREDWRSIFTQARDLGINFVLLVGGEPLTRPDVLTEAAAVPEVMFPVFTNGTILTPGVRQMFREHRNLVPVISIEGNVEATDLRRGEGTYNLIRRTMDAMKEDSLLFGASITVTKTNMDEVFSDAFVQKLLDAGCRAILYVEYVPVDEVSMEIAPTPEDNQYIAETIQNLREKYDKTWFLSFPGDEHKSGGCLAAGRGFFHINVNGNAEPCPASPYSDSNVKELGLREALKSPLFYRLRDAGILMEDHKGGCVLFENREKMDGFLEG